MVFGFRSFIRSYLRRTSGLPREVVPRTYMFFSHRLPYSSSLNPLFFPQHLLHLRRLHSRFISDDHSVKTLLVKWMMLWNYRNETTT